MMAKEDLRTLNDFAFDMYNMYYYELNSDEKALVLDTYYKQFEEGTGT